MTSIPPPSTSPAKDQPVESTVDTTGMEEEPLLKYQRLGKHLRNIFSEDSASAMAINQQSICIGTYSGAVHVLTLQGTHMRRLHTHFKKVNDISIDSTGQYIATGSDDGVVGVNYIATDIPEVTSYNYCTPVNSVQIQKLSTKAKVPNKKERMFATGGRAGQLIVNKKGWIIEKESTIHEGEGPIDCIRWNGSLVAWANDWGVKVFDVERGQRVTYIERPANCPPLELCRCQIMWEDAETLIVGWADCIKIVHVQKKEINKEEENFSPSKPAYTAEIRTIIHTDYFISGLSVWDEESIAVLAYRPPDSVEEEGSVSQIDGEGDHDKVPLPELHIISKSSGKDVAADALPIRGYERLRASDYKLVSSYESVRMMGKPILYIMSPKDIILCRERDLDDKVSWSLARKDYVRALSLARTNPAALRSTQMHDVVNYYLSFLFSKGEYEKAGQMCGELLGSSKPLWEKWIWVFAQRGELGAIASQVPTSNPRLDKSQYNMILKHFLEHDAYQLLHTIQKWPKPRSDITASDAAPEYKETDSIFSPLYNAEEWINRLESILRRRSLERSPEQSAIQEIRECYLMEALAELYIATEQYDHALRIYLNQGSRCSNKDHVFQMIVEHGLWKAVVDKVPSLLRIDQEAALHMMIFHVDHVPLKSVVEQLKDQRRVQLAYLHHFFLLRMGEYNVDKYATYHELQVKLYAEYDVDGLLPFLKTSNFVPLELAYQECVNHDPPLWDAMIYILGIMGNHKHALDVILNQLGNVEQAIQFVQAHDDSLWEYLIDLSLNRSDFIEQLLDQACKHRFDPRKVISKMPKDMKVDRLKEKICTIVSNYQIQLGMFEGCNKVFETDSADLLRKLTIMRKRGCRFAKGGCCAICTSHVTTAPVSQATQENVESNYSRRRSRNRRKQVDHVVAAFPCGHIFHKTCLDDAAKKVKKKKDKAKIPATPLCILCYSQNHSVMEKSFLPPSRQLTVSEVTRARENLALQHQALDKVFSDVDIVE